MTPALRQIQIEARENGFKAANFQVRKDGSFITGDIAPIARRLLCAVSMDAKNTNLWTRENRKTAIQCGAVQRYQKPLP